MKIVHKYHEKIAKGERFRERLPQVLTPALDSRSVETKRRYDFSLKNGKFIALQIGEDRKHLDDLGSFESMPWYPENDRLDRILLSPENRGFVFVGLSGHSITDDYIAGVCEKLSIHGTTYLAYVVHESLDLWQVWESGRLVRSLAECGGGHLDVPGKLTVESDDMSLRVLGAQRNDDPECISWHQMGEQSIAVQAARMKMWPEEIYEVTTDPMGQSYKLTT